MPKFNPNGKARVFVKAASCDFTANERLEVRQDAFTRGGEYLVKAGSMVGFCYVEPGTHNNWSRVVATFNGREHYVELPTANLRRPAK
jgi:hypothetical protein